jgi:hypothetical protein
MLRPVGHKKLECGYPAAPRRDIAAFSIYQHPGKGGALAEKESCEVATLLRQLNYSPYRHPVQFFPEALRS